MAVLNQLIKERLIEDYAIGGGIAAIFYIEPILTYDLDVFIRLQKQDGLQSLSPIYRYLENKGYSVENEQVVIEKIPVQFLPAFNELLIDAVSKANKIDYEGIPTKVMSVEHLLAIMLQASRAKDRERFFKVMEEAKTDRDFLDGILNRFALKEKFEEWENIRNEK